MNATNAFLDDNFLPLAIPMGFLASAKYRLKGSGNSPIASVAAGNPGGYPAFDPLRDGALVLASCGASAQSRPR